MDITDFEKNAFLDSAGILGVFYFPKRPFFAVRTFLKILVLFAKIKEKWEIFCDFLEILLSYPGVFFGPSRTIESLRNRIFRKKS